MTTADAGTDATQPRGCPFLLAEAGGWRLAEASRDHRCAAFTPAAPLSPEKQVRLCLTPTHTNCATFMASMAARSLRLGVPSSNRATRWNLARTTTVIEDPGGLRGRVLALVLDRRRWPAIPAVLLVTTLFTLAVSGFRGGGPAPAAATASPARPTSGPSAAVARTDVAIDTPTPTTTATEAPSPGPSPTSKPTPKPTPKPTAAFRTYVVKAGDSLSVIAQRFGTTPQAIARLSGIGLNSTLRVGQVLRIPS
jgi:LysM repeat protein